MMKFLIIVILLLSTFTQALALSPQPSSFKVALPGYKYKFPADHRAHNEYRTEWWYYSGHLQAEGGKEFGFELTFFRSAVSPPGGIKGDVGAAHNAYMAHFTVTDVAKQKFYQEEKLSHSGLASSGASESTYKLWMGTWGVQQVAGKHVLTAGDKDVSINLVLSEGKAPTIHGQNGISQKAPCAGCASHYYSLTRMPVNGKLTIAGKSLAVKGIAWMDHEFGTNQLSADEIGWNWYSIQLDDNTELMLYAMRLRNGQYDPSSAGTIIFADGRLEHLAFSSYQVSAQSSWSSPHTYANYPANWHVVVPGKNIDLNIEPLLADQEVVSISGENTYWEGACKVVGTKDGKPIHGRAYVELAGYAEEMHQNF
jgi:predicted secreted hydrolase